MIPPGSFQTSRQSRCIHQAPQISVSLPPSPTMRPLSSPSVTHTPQSRSLTGMPFQASLSNPCSPTVSAVPMLPICQRKEVTGKLGSLQTWSDGYACTSPKLSIASPVLRSGSPTLCATPKSPTFQPSEGGPVLELIRNGNANFDDLRLPGLMKQVSELSQLEFGEDIIEARNLSLYHKGGGSLDVIAAQPGNVVAGFCYYKPEPNDPDHSLQIMFLAVRKEFQKHGCGRLLVSLAVNNAKNGARIHRVRLMAAEKAIPFYETIGFRKEEKDEDDMSNWMEDLLYSNSSSVWMEIPLKSPGQSPVASPKSPIQGFVFEERSLVYNAFGIPSTEWARSPPSSPMGMPLLAPPFVATPSNGSTGWAPLFSDNFMLCEAEDPSFSPFGTILNDAKEPIANR